MIETFTFHVSFFWSASSATPGRATPAQLAFLVCFEQSAIPWRRGRFGWRIRLHRSVLVTRAGALASLCAKVKALEHFLELEAPGALDRALAVFLLSQPTPQSCGERTHFVLRPAKVVQQFLIDFAALQVLFDSVEDQIGGLAGIFEILFRGIRCRDFGICLRLTVRPLRVGSPRVIAGIAAATWVEPRCTALGS